MVCPSFMLSLYFCPQYEEMLPWMAFLFVCERGSQCWMDTHSPSWCRCGQAGCGVASLFLSGL